MSVQNFMGKIEVSAAIGEKLSKAAEAAEATVRQTEGATRAFRDAAKLIDALHAHVENDMEEEGIFPDMEPLAVKSYVKRYVQRAAECCLNASARSEAQTHIENGKLAAFQAAIELAQNHHNVAVSRAKQLAEAAVEADAEPKTKKKKSSKRKPGEHPGPKKSASRKRKAADGS